MITSAAEADPKRKAAWLVVPFALYAIYSAVRGDLRIDHLVLLAAVVALAVIGPRARELLFGIYPFTLVALIYDAMRPLQRIGLTESRVLVCSIRNVESRLFGWQSSSGERFTLHDFFQAHHAAPIDLFCAVPYATFLLWCVAGAIFLYVKDRPAMKRFAWGFFLLNIAGFLTYHLLPAAPPWYFHKFGCDVDLAARASEGPVLARVDAMIGIPYFHGMYARASSVFGALPSLHCAYPLLLIIEGWRAFSIPMRAIAIAYYIAMVFSAVYLDHHWVIDAVLGGLYTIVITIGLRALGRLHHHLQDPVAA